MDIDWDKPTIIKASIAGCVLLIAVVLIAKTLLGGSSVEVVKDAQVEGGDDAPHGGSNSGYMEDF